MPPRIPNILLAQFDCGKRTAKINSLRMPHHLFLNSCCFKRTLCTNSVLRMSTSYEYHLLIIRLFWKKEKEREADKNVSQVIRSNQPGLFWKLDRWTFSSAFNTFSPSSESASRLPGCHRRKFQRPAWCPQLPSHSWHSAEPTHSGQSAWRKQHARHKARKAPELPQPMLPALPFCSTFHCRSTCLQGNRFPHQLGTVAPPRIPPWCFKGWLSDWVNWRCNGLNLSQPWSE